MRMTTPLRLGVPCSSPNWSPIIDSWLSQATPSSCVSPMGTRTFNYWTSFFFHDASILGVMLNSKAFATHIALLSSYWLVCTPTPLDASPESFIYITQVVTDTYGSVKTETMAVMLEPPHLSSIPAAPSTFFQTITVTETISEPSTTTITAPPLTTTEFISKPPSSTQIIPSSSTAWSAPMQFSDMNVFHLSSFAYGQQNLKIVEGIPASASAVSVASASPIPGVPAWDNSSTILQLFYPQNSINPGSEPQGGADFYATPLDLSRTQNLTMEYSVFFPVDFDWVLAGKLPGIYGGHTGCSGGDSAVTCFSTRLMWREGGAGELYLVSLRYPLR